METLNCDINRYANLLMDVNRINGFIVLYDRETREKFMDFDNVTRFV